MQIITSPQELAATCLAWHKDGDDIALVPTMGYYHAGHEDLMSYGRTLAKRLVVSLFVNPAQFGPGEDLDAYPRDADHDADIAAKHGADVLFMPEPASMYAQDHATWVDVPELSRGLCGASRPIHFRGVCTVVLKLFMLTQANVAVFGQKDWQQQAILRRMVRDLNVPVRIETRETVREADLPRKNELRPRRFAKDYFMRNNLRKKVKPMQIYYGMPYCAAGLNASPLED